MKRLPSLLLAISILTVCPAVTEAGPLKVHGIFASNMAFGLGKTQHADIEIAQSNLPLLRFFSIDPNEQATPQDDIPAEKISTKGWAVSNPETSRDFSAIGYIFGARLQRSLGIPIGLIKSARGGASIEAIVPSHKFDDHPLAKRYAESVKQKIAAFDKEATSLQVWNNQLARAKSKGLPEDKWPKKPVNTAFLPAYDVQVPGLHPSKKRDHGERAARWALARIYGQKGIRWETASLVSAEPQGDEMILTFSQKVQPDDMNSIPRGFSIAGEDGKFYLAHARYRSTQDGARGKIDPTIIHVWSPLVKKPVAVRYGWATSPMGNLKIAGQESLPFPSFRTDTWNWPESEDPEVSLVDRGKEKAIKAEAEARCDYRRTEEAKRGIEILERIKVLGQTK
jgi:hypothetical protein